MLPLANNTFRKVLVFFSLLYLVSIANAAHIVGGDITVKWLNGNSFEVTLNFFRDCKGGGATFETPITAGLFDKVTNDSILSFPMNLISQDTLSLGDTCNPINNNTLCVEQGIFKATVTIPNNPNGYYISWLRCCRNNIIANVTDPTNSGSGSAGMVFYAEIPDPALHNSTPVFGSYPNAYMCVGQLNTKIFSCTDVDGDSLVYSLITPLNGTSTSFSTIPPPTAGPYTFVNWKPPYSALDMIGGIPTMTISAQTGMVYATPNTSSNGLVFVFAVRVEEYNKTTKVKLGEIRRDIQYKMFPCNSNLPPYFSSPLKTNYELIAGDSVCFTVVLQDPNIADSVFITANSELFLPFSSPKVTLYNPQRSVKNAQTKFCLQSFCSSIRDNPYKVTFNGRDSSCYGMNPTTLDVEFHVKSIDGSLKEPIPNVFTPNGDNKNDVLKVNAVVNDCFDSFYMKIYDRWGLKVYETDNFLFTWDGTHYKTGKDLSDGVYYYTLEGKFRDITMKRHGFVQMIR
jgi:gliding motility-associated-like protein